MKLSLCVIAKNEEKNIERCLRSVQSIADEMVVVDTGSTDQTVAIAERIGAKVYHFQWVDDFARARNYAISKARGDWILFLDADEYLSDESIGHVIPAIRMAIQSGAKIISSWLSNYEKNGFKLLNSLKANRLFQKDKHLHYVGAIHETLSYTGRGKLKTLDASKTLHLIHTGYSEEDRTEKQKGDRNLALLYKELEKDPNNGFLHFYISESHSTKREFKEALDYAKKAVECGNLPYNTGAKNAKNIVNLMKLLKYPTNEIRQCIHDALKQYPDYPDLYYALAVDYKVELRIRDAIVAYERVLEHIGNAFKYQSNALDYLRFVQRSLAELYLRIDNLPKSVGYYVEQLKADKYDSDALIGLLRILVQHEKPQDIVQFLQKIYQLHEVKDVLILLQASLHIGSAGLSRAVFSHLNPPQQSRLRKEGAYIRMLETAYDASCDDFLAVYRTSRDRESAICCIVCAASSARLDVLQLLRDELDEPMAKCVDLLTGQIGVYVEEEAWTSFIQILKLYIKLGETERALEYMRLLPNTLHPQIADHCFEFGRYEPAYRIYTEYLDSSQGAISLKSISALRYRASECLYRLGDYEQALQRLLNGIQEDPSYYPLYELAVQTCQKIGAAEQLTIIAEQAMQQFPDSDYFRSVAILSNT